MTNETIENKLNIDNTTECAWVVHKEQIMGCNDDEYHTSCGRTYDVDKKIPGKFCVWCGKKVHVYSYQEYNKQEKAKEEGLAKFNATHSFFDC